MTTPITATTLPGTTPIPRYREMLRAKIHRITVTEADLEYEGSLTLDRDLLDATDLVPFEKVDQSSTRMRVYPGHRAGNRNRDGSLMTSEPIWVCGQIRTSRTPRILRSQIVTSTARRHCEGAFRLWSPEAISRPAGFARRVASIRWRSRSISC